MESKAEEKSVCERSRVNRTAACIEQKCGRGEKTSAFLLFATFMEHYSECITHRHKLTWYSHRMYVYFILIIITRCHLSHVLSFIFHFFFFVFILSISLAELKVTHN